MIPFLIIAWNFAMPSHLAALSDKALLEQARNGSDDAAHLLSHRFFGKVTPAVREAWPSLRRSKHISVHAARRILAQAEVLATPVDTGAS
jgi:hypothetical protein